MLNNLLRWIYDNKIFLSVIVIAFIIRFYFFSVSLAMLETDGLESATPDSINYLKMANWFLGHESIYPEGRFFDWGIGHASWLAGILYVFKSPIAVVIFQIILSALSCGIIYKISNFLFDKRSVAVIASLFLVLSETSINLSILILSDTLYFFLFISGMYFLIRTLQYWKFKYIIASGILFGIAVLVRPIGQFWFLMLLVFSFVVWKTKLFDSMSKVSILPKIKIRKLMLIVFIILLIMTPWFIRNYVKYDIPTFAFSSARGIANIASWTEERLTGKAAKEIKAEWQQNYIRQENLKYLMYDQLYYVLQTNGLKYIKEHPFESCKTYIKNIRTNITALNILHRASFPKKKQYLITFKENLNKLKLNYLNLILSMTGLLFLIYKKEYSVAVILGIVYIYYIGMVGAILWQGSRIFYPGQIAAVILIGYVLGNLFTYLQVKFKKNSVNT